MVETTLMIIFWLDNGRTMTLSIPNPRSDLTQREVSMAMFELLKRGLILSENGGAGNRGQAHVPADCG